MNWHILGAGAMGCLWAARLWEQTQVAPEQWGNPAVTLLLRNDAEFQLWQEHKAITIRDEAGITKIPVSAQNLHQATSTIDNLLICTKAQDAHTALRSVLHLLLPDSRVLLLQNGIKAQREIAQAFPNLSLYCLSTSHGAYRQQPFDVVHAGVSDTYIGSFSAQTTTKHEPDESLLNALPVAAMRIRWDHDITKRLWTKFAINCAINALTVVYDCRNGDLLTLPAAAANLESLCVEIEHIMSFVPDSPVDLHLFQKVTQVLRSTAQNYSSTLQDVRRGRPSEIAYFNVYLCELAQAGGISSALNNEVLHRFHAIVNDHHH